MSEHSHSDEINQLEKLALGLLLYSGDPRISKSRLFLGRIPENLPIDIPLSEQSRVMGTLAYSEMHVEIVLESTLTPEEISGFYRTQFISQGWSELEIMRPQEGGFIYSHFPSNTNITLCQGSDGASLSVNPLLLDGITSVRLELTLDPAANPCAQQARTRSNRDYHYDIYRILPPLTPPPGTQQTGGGGGSTSDEVNISATLTADLAPDVVSKHYANQLSKAGWEQIEAGISGPGTWHTWRFTGEEQEPWTALFLALKTPEKPDSYFLYIRATLDKPESSAKGWLSKGRTTIAKDSIQLIHKDE